MTANFDLKGKARVIYHEDTEWVKKSELDKLLRQVSIYEKALEKIKNGDVAGDGRRILTHEAMMISAIAALEEGRKWDTLNDNS